MPRIKAKTVQEHRENQRAKILRVAFEIINEGDSEKINFKEISKRTRLARPSLYEYFKDKDDLIFAVLVKHFPEWQKETSDAMARVKNPEGKIEAFFNSQYKMVDNGLHDTLSALTVTLDESKLEVIKELHVSLFSLLNEPMKNLGLELTNDIMIFISGVIESSVKSIKSGHGKANPLAKNSAIFTLGGIRAMLKQS